MDFIFPISKLLRKAGGYQLSEDLSEFKVPLIKDIWKLCLNHENISFGILSVILLSLFIVKCCILCILLSTHLEGG